MLYIRFSDLYGLIRSCILLCQSVSFVSLVLSYVSCIQGNQNQSINQSIMIQSICGIWHWSFGWGQCLVCKCWAAMAHHGSGQNPCHRANRSTDIIFNARRMRTRVTVVCESVCYQSTACLRPLCNKMDIPANFSLNSQDFQRRDFATMFSFTSYSFILSVQSWPFSLSSINSTT